MAPGYSNMGSSSLYRSVTKIRDDILSASLGCIGISAYRRQTMHRSARQVAGHGSVRTYGQQTKWATDDWAENQLGCTLLMTWRHVSVNWATHACTVNYMIFSKKLIGNSKL